ncbi:RHS repeat-associated core domain-containing protein, partial [Kosakonia cowanii]|uniref:RHS repeat-associated core domain-containing protein n=1 Tax=Kosakonia cowanii TaxID=208223 RepID=UPI001F594C31
HPDAAVQYIYTENSYEPLARVDSHGEHADIFWYHTELNGLPDSVTDSNGDTVWRGASTAWGRSLRESAPVEWDTPQNLRFQGQYLDRETGLHYNTFRYYDPAGGCYTQMDPIGLAGGLNTYTYVDDPLGWVDPLGLVGCSTTLGKNMMEGMGLPRSTSWKGYQAHHIIPKELANHPALKRINYYIDDSVNGIFLRKKDSQISAMARHQGNHDGYTKAVKSALDKIDLSQSNKAISAQVAEIQYIARTGLKNGYPLRPLDMDTAGGAIGNSKVNDVWAKIFSKGGW